MLELHRGRFVEWTPSSVTALACAPGGALVACARECGAIEVYDARDWRCVARVPGARDDAPSALAWCDAFEDDGEDGVLSETDQALLEQYIAREKPKSEGS